MNRILLYFSFAVLVLSAGAAQALQSTPPAANFADPQAAAKANAHEDELYNDGTEALNNGDYDEAANKFDQVAGIRGRRADAALYWKAYSLNKSGNKTQALATIDALRKGYPQSRWLKDAGALELEMKGTANPDAISDEEMKLLAIQSMMNSDPEKVVPLLDKIIHGNYSPKLKDKALFVLSQSSSDKAQQILLSLAKANNDPELQKRAIRYIGMNGSSRNRGILKEIYNGTNDPS